MQKTVAEIRKEIEKPVGRMSAWKKGLAYYEEFLFDRYLELTKADKLGEDVRIGKISEQDLLDGCESWEQYSYCGNSLIYDTDICDVLCTASEKKKTRNGELPPNGRENWLDVQARALHQASRALMKIVNDYDKRKDE